jgi:hypothetical protein
MLSACTMYVVVLVTVFTGRVSTAIASGVDGLPELRMSTAIASGVNGAGPWDG